MQLLFKCITQFNCIFFYPFYTYENIPRDFSFFFIRKSNNIGVVIMLKIFPVNFQQIIVRAKYKVKLRNRFILRFANLRNPFFNFYFSFQIEGNIIRKKFDFQLILKINFTVEPLSSKTRLSESLCIKKIPLPEIFSMFSGAVGSGTCS